MNKRLFMVLLGCRPEGRNTEQHDIFFGVASSLEDLIPEMNAFWPHVELHIDAYLIVEVVEGYEIVITPQKRKENPLENNPKLYFINLGGYSPPDFEEFHKKILVVAEDMSSAIKQVKNDVFYLAGQNQNTSARSHVDDKMEVDSIIPVQELILDYRIEVRKAETEPSQTKLHIGYLSLSKI